MTKNYSMINVLSQTRFEEILRGLAKVEPIMILGDVGIDRYTLGDVTRISPEAPVPVLNVSKNWNKLGLAANISDNLHSLGAGSILCCVVGSDDHANIFEHLLEEIGLSTWGIVHDKSRPTTLKERVTTQGQQICRVDYEKTTPIDSQIEQKLAARVHENLSKVRALIIEDYDKGTLTPKLLTDVIKEAKEANVLIAVDPARHRNAMIYKGADLFKPNFAEAKMLVQSLGYREDKPRELCAILMEKLELKMVAITLGAEGMCLMEREKSGVHYGLIPTLATEVFDVSGAGDTVIATLVASLQAGASLEEAAWLSNCAAGVVVSKKGTATVNQQELVEFYQRLRKKLDV